ncbi:MAG: MHYT domain-containing protein, partial [Rhodothermales bacterium]
MVCTTGSYNPVLVLLSYLIAVLASYTALVLARRVAQSTGRSLWCWLGAGALAMGIGIWSMHFVGMLAFSMAFANYLTQQGHQPEEITTQATISLEDGKINKMHLETQGR